MKSYLSVVLIFCFLFTGACSFEDDDKDSYKVEGKIYGLQGELALNINDDEVLVIEDESSDAILKRFVFRQELLEGDGIVISIIKQPESQYCRFNVDSNTTDEVFSGVVENQDFIDLSIHCLSYNRISHSPKSISADGFHTCLIDNEGARCFGEDTNYYGKVNITDVTAGITNPVNITSSVSHGCVLDDTGIVCWGEEESTVIPVNIINPRELQVGEGFSCALDDDGVKCWGWDDLSSALSFDVENAKNLTVGRASVCVLDDGKPICRALGKRAITDIPDILDHVTYIAAYESTVCAIQDKKLYCWGGLFNSNGYGTELSADLIHINLSFEMNCLANVETVSCTEDPIGLLMKQMVNLVPDAKSIVTGRYHVCAMNDDDVLCFGSAFAYPESILTSN